MIMSDQDFVIRAMPSGTKYIETACVGKCSHPHRVDDGHPEYARVLTALQAGDRSVVFCYHKELVGR